MIRTYNGGLLFAEKERITPSRNWRLLCQMFSRSCVGADAWAGSAWDAWWAIPREHRHTNSTPRAGSLLYFGKRRPGHVVFVVDNGYCYSNDILVSGRISKVPWQLILDKWNGAGNMPMLGWIDWTPSGALNLKPIQTAKPKVDVSMIQVAAKHDPSAKAGTFTYKSGVLVVEKALVKGGYLSTAYDDGHYGTKTREAYVKVQKRYGSKFRDGIPRLDDLTKLGKAHGFTAVP